MATATAAVPNSRDNVPSGPTGSPNTATMTAAVAANAVEAAIELKAMEAYKNFFQIFRANDDKRQQAWNRLDAIDEKTVSQLIKKGSYRLDVGEGPVWQQHEQTTTTTTTTNNNGENVHKKSASTKQRGIQRTASSSNTTNSTSTSTNNNNQQQTNVTKSQYQKKAPNVRQVRARLTLLENGLSLIAAECNALFIYTKNLKGGFYDEMYDISRDTCLMARVLCDDKGRPRRDLWLHPSDEGTRSCYDAMSQQNRRENLLLFEFLHVAPTCRRQGMARMLIEGILNEVEQEEDARKFVAVAKPASLGNLNDRERKEQEDNDRLACQVEEVKNLFRKVGFRKVGNSEYFVMNSDDIS